MPSDHDDLILRIHAAALDPSAWTSIVEDLRIALNARGAVLHTPWVRSIEEYWYFNAQLDPAEIETYARDWMVHDVWVEGARKRGLYLREGLVCSDDALVEHRTFRRSAFFADFLRTNDMDRMVTINLHRGRIHDDAVHTQASLFRGVGEQAFSRADLELLGRLMPHLVVATRNFCSLRSLLAVSATTERALDSLAVALFALDRRGRLVYSNRRGSETLRAAKWLSSVGGKIAGGEGLVNARECSAAIRGVVAGTGATLMLKLGSSGEQRVFISTPIALAGVSRVAVPQTAIGLIWLFPDRPGPTSVDRMADLFELTPAESRLLAQLAEGWELRAVADTSNVSIHTARNHLKAILRKTGRRSQAQLFALLNRLAAIVADP